MKPANQEPRPVHQSSARKMSLMAFSLLTSALFCLTVVAAEFLGTPLQGWYSIAITGMQFIMVSVCATGLMALLAASRMVFAITFPLMMGFCSAMCFFRVTIGTRLSGVGIELAMVNGSDMWLSMISPGLVVTTVTGVTIGIVLAWWRRYRVVADTRARVVCAAVGAAIAIIPMACVPRIAKPVGARLPFSIWTATRDYLRDNKALSEIRHTYDNTTVTPHPTAAPDVIMVIGESLRADHLPMNGYPRNTMPLLQQEANLVNFSNLYSVYYFTDRSVPHILTEPDPSDADAAYDKQSFITLFDKAGYTTAWLANQELTHRYTYFAHEADTLINCNATRTSYDYSSWLDTDIIPDFSRWFNSAAGTPHLAVIHSIGSHWWYRSHYTNHHARFKPEITHKEVGGLSREAMINSYDNTIIATDEFLHRLIDAVRNRNVVVIYVSDHGEALGENGVFLHATDVDPLHHPAMMVWYSDVYATHFPEMVEWLKERSSQPLTTTDVFALTVRLGSLSTAMNCEASESPQ